MDEEVQIMGDSQDAIPRKVYEDLVAKWAKEIDLRHAEELLNINDGLRVAIMDKAEKLGLDERREDNLIVAVEALKDAIEGKGVERGLLPEGVSQLHISAKPEETKSAVQGIAQEALTKIKSREGRSR